ncbi:unnamed protein product [Oikopleura dioica]|uniref:Uncharacterized protein n=1 Tax=Oikopleura dioica TaxID=34765 RepID=E4X166_OIKDI|nr:unnamed protein product [Oikopleura dioica]
MVVNKAERIKQAVKREKVREELIEKYGQRWKNKVGVGDKKSGKTKKSKAKGKSEKSNKSKKKKSKKNI